jgi:hypothetical protein
MNLRYFVAPLLVAGFCCAQSPPTSAADRASTIASWKTKGNWNGRFWRSFDAEGQGAFLFGFGEAADLIVSITSGNYENYKRDLPLFWPPLTHEEIRVSLDRFYDTPENRPITIINALSVVSKRATGSSEDDIQAYVAKLRAAASK